MEGFQVDIALLLCLNCRTRLFYAKSGSKVGRPLVNFNEKTVICTCNNFVLQNYGVALPYYRIVHFSLTARIWHYARGLSRPPTKPDWFREQLLFQNDVCWEREILFHLLVNTHDYTHTLSSSVHALQFDDERVLMCPIYAFKSLSVFTTNDQMISCLQIIHYSNCMITFSLQVLSTV